MKYGKIGWNIMYEFNEFDFDGSFNVLNSLIGNGTSVCWASIKYFFGEVSTTESERNQCNCFIHIKSNAFLL